MQLTRADWTRLVLLWLAGVDLRLTLLAVPPLIPLIHREMNLDEKAVGALVSLPVVLFAVAAVPGFGALRGFGPSTPVLFASTFFMGIGVAVSQPAFPSLVREWFPARIT